MAPISKEADFLVIGGGSGGLAAARMASSKYGVKTLLVESSRLGGTCVNVGCVPKKVTFNAAFIAETIHHAKAYGFSVEQSNPFDWTAFKKKRDAYIERLNGIYERNLARDGVEYLHGRARLLSCTEVEVALGDGTTVNVKVKRILIAVGGYPNIPKDVSGADLGTDSNGFFDIDTLPERAVLIGGGYIAVELAGMFNALGVDTHLFIRGNTFLRRFDPMIQDVITKEYERLGVHVHRQIKPKKIEAAVSGAKTTYATTGLTRPKLDVHFSDSHGDAVLHDVDHLIWAIGRAPATSSLGLEAAGVDLSHDKGHIVVDEFQTTSADNIFALGDVTGQVELTPVAIAAGRKLAHRLFGPPEFSAARLECDNIPSVVFSHPEVGSIGLSEPEAVERFGHDRVKTYTTNFTALYYAMMEPAEKAPTSYKLVVEGPEERVIGLHIVGLGSAEMLQGFGVAIKMGATKRDFDNCVAIHPTSAEELVTLK